MHRGHEVFRVSPASELAAAAAKRAVAGIGDGDELLRENARAADRESASPQVGQVDPVELLKVREKDLTVLVD
ncbi:hypothetical protein [Glaciihabitans sp. dw_435]|uniref:hypothetical protein n=1 Tax=Glaciihabitans sp. dw_435 TaxID=2720081 RepID=UPI001BD5C370|nr:hypothetical protein [Glaciihabitans sp. dw_435]